MIDFSVIGLSKRDKRIYDALLKNTSASIRNIAEATGVNRGSVYESLKSLITAGLVTHVNEGKMVRYVAESPEKLHEIINEKRRTLLDAHTEVDTYIRHLDIGRGESSGTQFATFYEGDEGMASILRDVLSTARTQDIKDYVVISSPKVSEYLYNNFRHFTRERIKYGLQVKVLRQGTIAREEADLSRWKLIPGHSKDTGCYTIIYGTKVAVISIDTYNRTSGIIIDNEGVATTQRNLFELLW